MSTSRKKGSKVLGVITRTEAEGLLCDWANLRDDSAACLRLLSAYPEVFNEDMLPVTAVSLFSYRARLRKAWDAPDSRHRDWYLTQMRGALQFEKNIRKSDMDWGQVALEANQGDPVAQQQLQNLTEPPPAVTPLEAALFYLQTKLGDRAKHCAGPDCMAPYFIAVKRWQKYCSPECAGPATREAKRRWWSENRAKNGGLQ